MNYDDEFLTEPNKDFFYNDDDMQSNIFLNGYISLENARNRLKKGEYYALVPYNEGEELPKGYRCFTSQDGELYATPNSELSFDTLVDGDTMQMIYKVENDKYRLGPKGPDIIFLIDLAYNQLDQYTMNKIGR